MSDQSPLDQIRAARGVAREILSRFGEVAFVGIGKVGGDMGLIVGFKDRLPDPAILPKDIGGFSYECLIAGQAEAYQG